MKKHYDDEQENTTACRVRNLRLDKNLSQKQLANRLFVAHSQISRLESGETTNISSSLLVALAKEFHVSTDYLLCLTPISVPKSYDISQLGLSEEAVKRLITKKIDASVLNRLLEHKDFPKLCVLMKNYFDNTVASGIMARNQVIDFATEPLVELMSAEPSKRAEIIKDMSFLNSTKIQNNEADVEKIKNILMKIIREIKEDVTAQQPTGAIATAEAVNAIRDSLPDKPQSELTIDDVSTAVATYVGTMLPMDENTSALLQQLAKQMLETPMEGKE
ncbi:MAG: helix-turn-helix transcriptional regulator [Evtepia sp.]|nr:helix-turn-helix transcriptional regulator [Evtepia sp.]